MSRDELNNNEVDSVVAQLEARLQVGNVVSGIDEAYLIYAEYGNCIGFGVRKGRQLYYNGTHEIRRKEIYCSCNGYFSNSKEPVQVTPSYSRQHHRSGCAAMIRIQRAFGGSWIVTKFVKEHNHELLSPDNTYLLRSSRNLSSHKKFVLDALRSAGIGVAHSYRFMEYQSGGAQHVGFTKIDAFNHADSSKGFTRVTNGDARALLKYCIHKSNTEASFYYNVKLDSEGRLMHIYYRDTRCLADYEAFCDVMLVDTTYRTNKYDIVVAPFVGVNHHKQNILFGMGFLSTETTADFKWLFSSFLESMNGTQPKIIFTDQCQAMMSAIDSVFPNVCHRLCHWHISRNAPSHFGALNQNKEFLRMWRRCMMGVESEDEFEQLWAHMRHKYGLDDVPWFGSMYNLKRRWASVFSQDLFSCGMCATSRSEATNRSLKENCASTHSLFEFVQCYEKMKTEWRNREVANDVANIGNPGRCAIGNPMLLSASRILTRTAYLLFEKQMIYVLNYDIASEILTDDLIIFKVKIMQDCSDDELCSDSADETGELSDDTKSKNDVCKQDINDSNEDTIGDSNCFDDTIFSRRMRTVSLEPSTNLARCSCKTWERLGIICRHILKVYNAKQVKVLPDCYFLPRWSKDAKLRLFEARLQSAGETKLDGLERLAYVNCFMRVAKEVVEQCQYEPPCRIVSLDKMKELKMCMLLIMENNNSLHVDGETEDLDKNSNHGNGFRDPPPSRRRGKRKQSKNPPKSHWDFRSKGSKKKKPHPIHGAEKHAQATLNTESAATTSQSKRASLVHPLSFNEERNTHWMLSDQDPQVETENGSVFGTQQSSLNHTNHSVVGIADVWKFEDDLSGLVMAEATCKRKQCSDDRVLGVHKSTTDVVVNLVDDRDSDTKSIKRLNRGPRKIFVTPDFKICLSPHVPLCMDKFPEFSAWLNSGYTPRGLSEVEIPGCYVIEANLVWFQTLVNPYGLLSDEHIDALLNLLITTSRRAPNTFIGGWSLIESRGWAALCSDAIANRNSHILPYVSGLYPIQGGCPWKEAQKIYGVAHIGPAINGHWVLFEVVIGERKIVIYDSLSRTSSWDMVAKAFSNVRFNLTTLLSSVDDLYPSNSKLYWDLVKYEHPPQQSNGCDCGVMAIKFLECLLTGWDFTELDPNYASNWRYLYGAALYRMGLQYENQQQLDICNSLGL